MISTEFLITSLIVVLIPGTGVIYTISMGLFKGYKASIYAALGCTLGIVPSLLASIWGLALVIHTSAIAFQIIKFLGVAYLFYLAWSMWKETGSFVIDKKDEKSSLLEVASKAFLVNILNPKLTLFFLAFLPQFIPQQTEAPLNNMLSLGGVFMMMTLCVFILYGLLANSIRGYIINSPVAMKYIQRAFATSFAILGAKLAMTER